ncbi:hypothetical protein LMG29542_03469 [Paraburkholderia humisilvae]|uniref:Uncharacterized protein n=1 Tax=Paraburkholderia humisilvae TaxID=627669 RepID=A0A6J5DZN0_9BURK|nr:hypothetical protein LMG29542_03469 [Paraburkholderia humisilvae]
MIFLGAWTSADEMRRCRALWTTLDRFGLVGGAWLALSTYCCGPFYHPSLNANRVEAACAAFGSAFGVAWTGSVQRLTAADSSL